jgi:hypothetical protein
MSPKPPLADSPIHVKFKLSALWATIMFCYIYADVIALFRPGQLQSMLAGQYPFGAVSQGGLLGMAILLSIPGVMVFLSLVLKPGINRLANIVFGLFYTFFVLLTMLHAWQFYIYYGIIDVLLSALIISYAAKWPRLRQ